VDHHHLVVGGELQVHLERVRPLLERHVEGRQRVRRRVALRAGVGDDADVASGEVGDPVLDGALEADGDEHGEQQHPHGEQPAGGARSGPVRRSHRGRG
jgi:hypothetical protein